MPPTMCSVFTVLTTKPAHQLRQSWLQLPCPTAEQLLPLAAVMRLRQIKGGGRTNAATAILQAANHSANPAAACHTFSRLLAEHWPGSLQEEDIDEGDATDYEDDTSANGLSGAMSTGAKEDSQGASWLRICYGCSPVNKCACSGWLAEAGQIKGDEHF